MSEPVPVAGTAVEALAFLIRRFPAIVGRAALPIILTSVTWYLSLDAYLSQLALFLRSPNTQVGSLALGLVSAGFFLALLFHAILTIALTELAFGIDRSRWRFFRASRPEWRLYAAMLRVLLIFVTTIAGVTLTARGLVMLLGSDHRAALAGLIVSLAYVASATLTVVLVVRVGFLLAPIVIAESGQVLRRAFALTHGQFLRLFGVMLICAMPGFLVQIAGEGIVRATGHLPAIRAGEAFAQLVDLLQRFLPQFVSVAMASYLVTIVLFSGAAVPVYRRLADVPG